MQKKKINFDNDTKENIKAHNTNWRQIPAHSYRILIVGSSGPLKTNSLFNLIVHQPKIDKLSLYAKGPEEGKYHLLINKRESVGLKNFNNPKTFIQYLNDMDEIYKNIEEYNLDTKKEILIVVDDIIADMLSNKKLNPVVTELFIRDRKLCNMYPVFITQSYFAIPKLYTIFYYENSEQTRASPNCI